MSNLSAAIFVIALFPRPRTTHRLRACIATDKETSKMSARIPC